MKSNDDDINETKKSIKKLNNDYNLEKYFKLVYEKIIGKFFVINRKKKEVKEV